MDLTHIPEWLFLGNTLVQWGVALAVAAATYVGTLVVKRVALGQLKSLAGRTDYNFAPVAVSTLKATRQWFLLLVAARAGTLALWLPPRLEALLQAAVVVGVVIQLAIWGNTASRIWLKQYTERTLDHDASAVTTMRAVVFIARVLVWSVVLLVALDNLGVDITALIAGLGVGGIAVALAVQNILGDLFASLSIVIDKPFVVGDFIIVDDYLGTVQHVGLKTTRVMSLSGEQLVFSNADLLNSRIRNYKRMNERRIVFSFGVVYQTRPDTLERITEMIREIIDEIELARFDRAHFKAFGSSALEFEVVYHVLVPDFNRYMDIQQEINLALYRRLEAEGVTFAYPTQTLYLQRQPGERKAAAAGEAPLAP